RDRGSRTRSVPPQAAMAGFPHLLHDGHRGGLDRSQEIRREGWRGRLQEGAGGRGPLQVRLRHVGGGGRAGGVRSVLAQAAERSAARLQGHPRRIHAAGRAQARRGGHRLLHSRGARRGAAPHARPAAQVDRAPRHVLGLLSRAVGHEVSLAQHQAAPGGEPCLRSQRHQPAETLGFFRIPNSIVPDIFDFFWKPPAAQYDPAKAKRLLAEAGYPNGFDAGEYFCDVAYANVAEAVQNYLQAVGIRTTLRPLERAAFFSGYGEKKFKNLIQAASGAFGNAATRLEA